MKFFRRMKSGDSFTAGFNFLSSRKKGKVAHSTDGIGARGESKLLPMPPCLKSVTDRLVENYKVLYFVTPKRRFVVAMYIIKLRKTHKWRFSAKVVKNYSHFVSPNGVAQYVTRHLSRHRSLFGNRVEIKI